MHFFIKNKDLYSYGNQKGEKEIMSKRNIVNQRYFVIDRC